MNVALGRVLYAHALNAAPRLALGRMAPAGRLVGDPRLGTAGVFLSLRRVLPDRYPLTLHVDRYIADEQRLGGMLDYAVIVPSWPTRASSGSFATATRSTPGHLRSDVCGTRSRCHSQPAGDRTRGRNRCGPVS
jgi:hypothetical protein